LFQSHRRNEQILQRTETCWKETKANVLGLKLHCFLLIND
jgi:hypothetical protein